MHTFCGGDLTGGSFQLQTSRPASSPADSAQRSMQTPAGVNNSVPCPPPASSAMKTLPRQPLSPAGPRPVLKLALFKLQLLQLPQQTAHSTLPTFPRLKLVQHGCPRCVPFAPSAIRQSLPPLQAPLRKNCGHQDMPQHAYSWNKQTMRPCPPLILFTLLLLTHQTPHRR